MWSSPLGTRRSATAALCACLMQPAAATAAPAKERKHVVISDVSIRRPVFATVMSLVVALLGLVSFQRLTVREYPNIDPPVVTVETTYRGAGAAIMESQVTQVLEDSLSGIEGIDFI